MFVAVTTNYYNLDLDTFFISALRISDINNNYYSDFGGNRL